MSHTKTFDCEGCRPYCYGGYHMREDADGDGDYVLAEDFNRVIKQRDELLEAITAMLNSAAPEWESESGIAEYAEACVKSRAAISSAKGGA